MCSMHCTFPMGQAGSRYGEGGMTKFPEQSSRALAAAATGSGAQHMVSNKFSLAKLREEFNGQTPWQSPVQSIRAERIDQLLRPLADSRALRFGKSRVVNNWDSVRVQETRHALGVPCTRQRASNDDSMNARQHSVQIRRISLYHRRRSHA